MAASGLTRQVLQDFSGGIFRNSALDRIPANGSWDLLNGLLDLQGGHYARGGSTYRSAAVFGASLRWIWDGWLASGQVTLLASPTAFGRLESNGTVTNLGEGGLAAPVRPAVLAGKMFFPGGKTYDGTTWATLAAGAGTADYVTVAANRLLVAHGSKIRFSKIGDPATFAETDFHEIPGGVQILGLEGSRESCVVFTTAGIWVIGGLTNALVDVSGNVQQRLDHYSGDISLWGDAGISSWEGSLIVPGTDAIWLIKRGVTSEQVGSFERISDSIRDVYREYVSAGFTPGRAVVFNNHYLLPIIGAGRIIDFLVCRLDLMPKRGQPRGAWTRFAGAGAQMSALASRVSSGGAREPELLGAGYASARAVTLGYFNPATNADADGSTPEWAWQTGAIATGNLVPNLVSKIRLRYQLQPTPVEAEVLPALAVVDNFNRTENPLSDAGKWTALTGVHDGGKTNGTAFTSVVGFFQSGSYWNVAPQPNPAVLWTIAKLPGAEGLGSLWGCVQAGAQSGYRLRWQETAVAGVFTVKLERWVAGVPTILQTVTVTFAAGDKLALTVRDGVLRGWRNGIVVVTAADATYTTGYVGIEAALGGEYDDFAFGETPVPGKVSSQPVITAAIASDAPAVGASTWGSFVWGVGTWASPGTANYEPLSEDAPVDVNAGNPHRWNVRKKRRYVSFRFSCQAPAARIAVKALELFVRPQGRL